MIVGHTKFAPDGYFGLIRKRYRRSNIYTYEDLIQTILDSSESGHNICQSGRNDGISNNSEQLIYRDWSSWLLKFFKKLPDITSYRHFKIVKNKPGMVLLKKTIDGDETEIQLLKRDVPFGKNKSFRLPTIIRPKSVNGIFMSKFVCIYQMLKIRMQHAQNRGNPSPKSRIFYSP